MQKTKKKIASKTEVIAKQDVLLRVKNKKDLKKLFRERKTDLTDRSNRRNNRNKDNHFKQKLEVK